MNNILNILQQKLRRAAPWRICTMGVWMPPRNR